MAAGVLDKMLYRKLPLLLNQRNVDTLVCSGCHKLDGLNNRSLLPQCWAPAAGDRGAGRVVLALLELGGAAPGLSLLAAAPGLWQHHPNFHTAFSRVLLWVQISPFYKVTSHTRLGPATPV